MFWALQNLLGGSGFNNLAMLHYNDAISYIRDDTEIMGNE